MRRHKYPSKPFMVLRTRNLRRMTLGCSRQQLQTSNQQTNFDSVDTNSLESRPRTDIPTPLHHRAVSLCKFCQVKYVSRRWYCESYCDFLSSSGVDHIQARFRVYGHLEPVFPRDKSESFDLAHVFAGGRVEFTSDQHFGVGSNLILPGRGKDMGDGWETKRSRQKNHKDWVIVKL